MKKYKNWFLINRDFYFIMLQVWVSRNWLNYKFCIIILLFLDYFFKDIIGKTYSVRIIAFVLQTWIMYILDLFYVMLQIFHVFKKKNQQKQN